MASTLHELAAEVAGTIELASRQAGVPYSAAQSEYGVGWKETPDGGVRVFDCDGEGFTAHDATELHQKGLEWLENVQRFHGEHQAAE